MKILSIKTNGFRKFPGEFSSKFYEDVTYIYGGNHKGKTNILFAIAWAFLGSNLTGDERVYLGNNKKNDYYVELEFKDNQDILHTIIRYKNRYDNNKNFLTLDGKIVKQEDLISFYNNKTLFLAILNLSYFVNFQPAKQKELIDKYLPNVDIKEIYSKLPAEEQKILNTIPVNIKLLIKDLDDDVKFMEQKITTINGKIEYAEKIASEKLEQPPEFTKEQEYVLSVQELDSLRKRKTNEDIVSLSKKLSELQDEEFELRLEINRLDKELQNGKKIYQKMISEEDACCPLCQQKLNDLTKLTTTKQYRSNLMQLFDKQNKLKEKLKVKHFDTAATQGKILALEGCAEEVSAETLDELEKNIKLLEKEKQDVLNAKQEYSIKLQNIKNAQQDISNFKTEIEQLNASIIETKRQSEITKKLYFDSIKEKMSSADKYLHDVKIRFYKIVKTTGEIKDDFVITYKDKDFSTLSRSEKIAASLEIANMLNEITKLHSPLFIDDSESYPDFDFINQYKNNQIFIAQVKKGRTLKITNGQEVIAGFNTTKHLYKESKQTSQLTKVA